MMFSFKKVFLSLIVWKDHKRVQHRIKAQRIQIFQFMELIKKFLILLEKNRKGALNIKG